MDFQFIEEWEHRSISPIAEEVSSPDVFELPVVDLLLRWVLHHPDQGAELLLLLLRRAGKDVPLLQRRPVPRRVRGL